ncbi:hypothetical protein [Ekhidna sp.]|uniref:hypothetical protein n=1 Tax=Ekhidna sp. TaxID=2608089 RepID=UPI003B512B38
MKNLKAIAILLVGTLLMVSCGSDDGVTPTDNNNTLEGGIGVLVNSNITSDKTWSNDSIYVLASRVTVESGATLTIEPGCIIKGRAGTGANATALLIARGAKIMAEGTASAPIIFTSEADQITLGQINSPNLTADLNGLWGGLLVLGNARISADNESEQIEGIPATDTNGLYGGTDDADNSGVIRYVSVRHGGANIGEGNEINGITLGGVGSGTTIEYVEVVGNQDDGIEWFGGTVSVSNAIVVGAGDDAIDTDQAWAGTLNNFIVINPGDEAFELDGPEGIYAGAGHTITNGTVKADGATGLIDFDANTDVNMSNIYFFDLTFGQDVEEYADYAAQVGFDATSIEAAIPTVDADGNAATYTTADFFVGMGENVTAVARGTVGANVDVFADWTFASVTGELSDF